MTQCINPFMSFMDMHESPQRSFNVDGGGARFTTGIITLLITLKQINSILLKYDKCPKN